MRAVEAVMECLKAEGVDVVFGLPGGANIPTYDALYDAGHPPHPRPSRGGRRPRCRGLREGDGQGRRLARHQRPGRDEPRHADHGRDDGLRPGGLHHRPGHDRTARHGRLPGGRRHRHHDAGRQALVHDPAPDRDPAGAARGVPHRADRSPRPSRRRHPDRPVTGGHHVRAGDRRPPARLPAVHRGQHEADPSGGQGAGGGAPSGASTAVAASSTPAVRPSSREFCRSDRFPVTVHAHGPRCLPGPGPAVAGDARDARHPRGELRDGRGGPHLLRSAPGSTTASPASCRSSRRGRSSSTSTSIRPRSPRTCRRTSRSWVTPRTCWRSSWPSTARWTPTRPAWTSGGSGSTAGTPSTRSATTSPTPRTPRSSPSG